MILLRAILFNLLFYLWTGFIGIVGLPVLLAPRRTVMRFGRLWSAVTLKLLAATVGLTHELRGVEHLPPGGGILAMKHQSAWDTLVLPVLFDDVAAVIKRELTLLPLYGWYVLRAGSIPVDRKGGGAALKRMVALAGAAAAAGRLVAIFPEGTRTAVSERRPYHPGVAALYSQLDLPLIPVAVNSGLYWGRRSFMKRRGRIIVEILPPFPPGLPRRKVMAELETRIEDATARLVAEGRARDPATGWTPVTRGDES
jgi:1-acyl-sn-glycerol-3-phosphate acyltransferase